jgi:hypothetical protein
MKQQDPQKLARALGVKLLLRGTVTSGANGGIAITLTLDDVGAQGRNILHQDFSGVRQDLLTLEDQIFSKLVSTLEIKQSNEELARKHRSLRPLSEGPQSLARSAECERPPERREPVRSSPKGGSAIRAGLCGIG